MSRDATDREDTVDRIVAQWHEVRPDLDPSGKEITGRLIRLADEIHRRNADVFSPLGLNGAQYGVLAGLRRAGKPYELTPTDLARAQMMTSGGMTPVIDHLESAGLVVRRPNPEDRRGRLVALSPAGLALIDRAMEAHATEEQSCVDGLTKKERGELADLLRRLSLSIDED